MNLKMLIFSLAYLGRDFLFVFCENYQKNQKALSKLTDLYQKIPTYTSLSRKFRKCRSVFSIEFLSLKLKRRRFKERCVCKIKMHLIVRQKKRKKKEIHNTMRFGCLLHFFNHLQGWLK